MDTVPHSAPPESTVVVFLVHGTWARRSQWVHEGSPLCRTIHQALQDIGSRVVFRVLRWTGANRSADRLTAANALNVEFAKACDEFPEARVMFVGHSHGGSVIAYFWRALPDHMKARIGGAAFLSTPFIATRMRPNWRKLIAALAIVTAIGVFTALMAGVALLEAGTFRLTFGAHARDLRVTMLFILIWALGLVIAEWVRRRVIRWGDRVADDLQSTAVMRETTRLRGITSVFLRATGDEAAGALGAGQFAMWLSGALNLGASRVIVGVSDALSRSMLRGLAGLLIAALYALWVGGVVADLKTGYFNMRSLFGAHQDIPTAIQSLQSFAEAAVFYLSTIVTPLFVPALLFMLFAALGMGLCLLALWGAGWAGIKEGLFTEIAAEPVPLGTIELHHLDWATPADGSSLRHSYTYTNPDALKLIGDWIRDTFNNRR